MMTLFTKSMLRVFNANFFGVFLLLFLSAATAYGQCYVAGESNPVFVAAVGCNDGSFRLGAGAQYTFTVTPNTNYAFSFNANGSAASGFCGSPNAGAAFNDLATWNSGGATSLTISSNRTGAWNGNSGIMTYRHIQPNAATANAGVAAICIGSPISVTGGGGGNGVLYYQGTVSNGTNTSTTANPQTFVPGAAGTFTYYWRANNGGCWGNQGGATVSVSPTTVGGTTTPSSSSACINTTVGIILSGYTGTIVNWEYNYNGAGWVSFGNPNIASVTSPSLNQVGTYQFRVNVQSSPCSATTSSVSTVTVAPTTVGGTATAALSTICSGSNTTITLTTQVGTVLSWERNINGAGWVNIGNAGATTISTGVITTGSYQYRAIVQSAPCASQTSSIATINVDAPSVGGNASSTGTLLCNGDNPTISLTGNNGTILYWERQVNGGGFNNIGNAGLSSFSAGALAPGTYDYRAVSQNGTCPSATSASITVTVSSPSVGGTAIPQIPALCQGSSTNVNLSGQTGNILNWEQQIDGGGWSNIGSTGLTIIGTGALNTPGNNEFRAIVKNGGCPTVQSAPASIAVSPTSVGGTVVASASSVCDGDQVSFILSGETGTILNWERQYNGGGWTNIGNAGSNLFTSSPLSPAGTYEFRAVVQSGVCAPVASASVSVTVNPYDNAAFNYSASVFCQGGINPSPSIALGGGTFTATPAGLDIDAGTGIINLNTSAAGSYSITYTTSGVCPSSATQSVTVVGGGNAAFSYTNLNYCLNGAAPTPTVNTGGGSFTSSPAGLIFSNTSTGLIDLTNSVSGSYYVSYTLPGTCPSTQTQTVNLVSAGNSTFAYSSSTYCLDAGTNPSPSIAQLGGTFSAPAGIVFSSNQTGTINLAASTAGTYVITYNSGGPCATISTQSITLNGAGNAQFSYSTASYCSNVANPTPTVTTAGGTFTSVPAGITFVSASTGEINLAASQPGTYSITYSLAGACPSSVSHTVTVTAPGNSTFAYSSNAYCLGSGSNPSPIVSQFGGTFSASPAGLVFTNNQTGTVDLAASTAGTYVISYNSGGPCPTTSTQTVTLNGAGNAQFNYSAITYCKNVANPSPTVTTAGGTFTAVPAGMTFVSTSTGEINLTASQAGSYTITYTISGACPSSVSHNVTITTPANSSFAYANSSYCLGGSNNPSPSIGQFGGTFSASPFGLVFSNNQTGTIDLMSSTAGTYTVSYNSGGACPSITTQTITLNDAGDPLFFYFASTFCKSAPNPVPFVSTLGGSFTSSPAGLLFVSPATGEINLATSLPGGYVVTYNTGGACPMTYSQNVLVIANQNATFIYPQSSYCQSDANPIPTVSQIGGAFTSTAGLVFENMFTGKINLAASTGGTYTVTYTVPGTCSGVYTQQITINAGAVATLSYPASSFCSNDVDPVATVTPSGGTFTSSPLGLSINAAGTIDLSASVPGAYSVSYTAPGACGTIATSNVIIVTSPQAFIQPINTLCTGSPSTILTASPAGGTWSGGAYISASGTFNPAVSGSGTFPVNYVVSGSGGCSASATYNVVVNTSPTVSITPAGPFCSNDSIQVLTASPLGGTWSGNPFVSINGLFFPAEAGPGVYPVMYTVNNGGCTASTVASIQVLNSPIPVINPVSPICASGSPIGLSSNISGGTWSGGPYVSASGTFTPALASVGNNTVTYTVVNGVCSAQSSAQISVNGNPNVNIITPTPFCQNDGNDFIVANIPGGVFAGGSYVSGSGLFHPSLATVGNNVVIYTVTGSNGCVGSDTANVVVNANPDATITYPGLVCQDEAPFNLVAATVGGTWSGGPYVNSGTFDAGVAGVGTHPVNYSVTVGGCSSSASISITVDPKPFALFIYQPNGLTAYFTDGSLNADTWSWNFGDGSPEVTTQSPTHLYPDNGIYQTRLVVTNDCGSDTLILPVFVNKSVGIDENGSQTDINIFPNPTDQFLQITASQLGSGDWKLNVLDVSGKTVLNEMLYPTSGSLNKTIDVSTLRPGVYFINIQNNEKVHTVKFVKL